MTTKTYWENIYSTKSFETVSWYQPHSERSFAWISRSGIALDAPIIDVGGGASTLVDDLLGVGYRNITVLDLSGAALRVAQQRLGSRADQVHWCEADVTTANLPAQKFAVWHDRAVFHFLTEPTDRKAYVEQLLRVVKPNGHIIISTFSLGGPTRCSGLPIIQYSAETLQTELGAGFQLTEHANDRHTTPSGAVQNFIYCHFIKSDGPVF